MNRTHKNNNVRKVTIVDDDPAFLDLFHYLANIINDEIEFSSYSNPVEAASEIVSNSPDILFIDLNMPKLSGWELLEILARKKVKSQIYIVTSSIDTSEYQRASNHPLVSSFISKPLTINQFQDLLQRN